MSARERLFEIVYAGGEDAVTALHDYLESRAEMVDRVTDAFVKPRWIPVGERLPELHEHVIGWQQGWARTAEVWRGSKGQWLGGDFEPADEVSHWMPLPVPPTEAK